MWESVSAPVFATFDPVSPKVQIEVTKSQATALYNGMKYRNAQSLSKSKSALSIDTKQEHP